MLLAKLDDRVVEIVRIAHDVRFSDAKDWLLISLEPGDLESLTVRWLPAETTKFWWVREFRF
jgi:hypothetical protein